MWIERKRLGFPFCTGVASRSAAFDYPPRRIRGTECFFLGVSLSHFAAAGIDANFRPGQWHPAIAQPSHVHFMTFGSSGCYARRFLGCYVVAIMLLASPAARTAELTFDQAAERGMVDMAANKPPSENAELFAHLHEIDPGIIDGFAFFFAGPTQQMLDSVAQNVGKIHQQSPDTLTVAGWSESVQASYDQILRCGGRLGDHRFTAANITSGRKQTGAVDWIDMAKPEAAPIGALFVPPLDTCGGCTPRSAVVDACEKPPNPSPAYTEYNAVRCGDLPTIREALHEHDVR